jgi:transcriptional antiterminator
MSDERRNHQDKTREHVPTQLEVLRNILLLAAQYEAWLTLSELARKTQFPEASISAQLRHLRKSEHGAYRIEKRRREWEESLRTNSNEKVWEYRLAV